MTPHPLNDEVKNQRSYERGARYAKAANQKGRHGLLLPETGHFPGDSRAINPSALSKEYLASLAVKFSGLFGSSRRSQIYAARCSLSIGCEYRNFRNLNHQGSCILPTDRIAKVIGDRRGSPTILQTARKVRRETTADSATDLRPDSQLHVIVTSFRLQESTPSHFLGCPARQCQSESLIYSFDTVSHFCELILQNDICRTLSIIVWY